MHRYRTVQSGRMKNKEVAKERALRMAGSSAVFFMGLLGVSMCPESLTTSQEDLSTQPQLEAGASAAPEASRALHPVGLASSFCKSCFLGTWVQPQPPYWR